MLLKEHTKYYDMVLETPGILESPFLMVGYQEVGPKFRNTIDYQNGVDFLKDMGVEDITTLDGYDRRADWNVDLSRPIDILPEDRFKVVFDIGCIEHVWNAPQALLNYRNLLQPGGIMFIHTPVMGYHGHGYVTFHPHFFLDFFRDNGDDVLLNVVSTKSGEWVYNDSLKHYKGDALLWIVARKNENEARKFIKYPVQTKFRKRQTNGNH